MFESNSPKVKAIMEMVRHHPTRTDYDDIHFSPILFVDLDQSLIVSDITREQMSRALLSHPLWTLKMIWIKRFNPAKIKSALLYKFPVDVTKLPYRQNVLELIQVARKKGVKICLATASHQVIAHDIANHLGVFDGFIGSHKFENVKGLTKLKKMREIANQAPFDYIGDSAADRKIFPFCRNAIIVGHVFYDGENQIRLRSHNLWEGMLRLIIFSGLWFMIVLMLVWSLYLRHGFWVLGHYISFYDLAALYLFAYIGTTLFLMKNVERSRSPYLFQGINVFSKGLLTIDQGIYTVGFAFSLMLYFIFAY